MDQSELSSWSQAVTWNMDVEWLPWNKQGLSDIWNLTNHFFLTCKVG